MIIYENYVEIFNEMKNMILSSKESIYIFSWLFDFDFKFNNDETFYDILVDASKRGVKINMLLINNVLYPHIKQAKSIHNLNIKYIDSPCIYRAPVNLAFAGYLFYKKTYPYEYRPLENFKKPGHFHNKLLLIDNKELLLGGVDTDKTRVSYIKSPDNKKYNCNNYVWDEIAIKIASVPEQIILYIKKQYEMDGKYNPDIKALLPYVGNFRNVNNEITHIKHIINQANKYIYIEAQYIFSYKKNTLLKTLLYKILSNIKDKKEFSVVISTNYIQLDISNVSQKNIFTTKLHKYIKEIIHLFKINNVSPNILKNYLSITYFNDIKIHNKMILNEHMGCFTSSNFLSRSFKGNDIELGLLLDKANSEKIFNVQSKKLFNTNNIKNILKTAPNLLINCPKQTFGQTTTSILSNIVTLGTINKYV
uniref:PLD phosphodiesterase domain-containing protein n=1 Tax=viral metagenome TaxID=1070528 RepID=A0A6C0EKE6_9ZZZZ